MKIFVLSRTGADSVITELETDRQGNIEIPKDLGETHNLYGDADGRRAEFRYFRTIPDSALNLSRIVNAQHDLHNLTADVLPEIGFDDAPPIVAKTVEPEHPVAEK